MYIALTIISLFILSTSLSDLAFEPGQPIPIYDTDSTTSEELGGTSIELKELKTQPLLLTLLPLSAIIVFFVLLISLIKTKDINSILKLSLFLLIPLVLAILINWIPSSPKPVSSYNPAEEVTTVPKFYNSAPYGEPSKIIFGIIGVGLLLIIAGLIIYLIIDRKKEIQKNNLLAEEADNAIKAIEDGQSIDNVIIYCYLRMSEIIFENRGIERKPHLTPREFEIQLVSEGIPLFPIQQLTKLFEEIRYGNKLLDHQAKKVALDSLKEISNYFRHDITVTK